MVEVVTSRGVVRSSTDGWGVGLYSDDNVYRSWFLTPVNAALRPGNQAEMHQDGLPHLGSHTLLWVGLNPSRSDDNGKNRTTLRSVLYWAERAGLMSVLGVNLYAYRHTDPKEIRRGIGGHCLGHVIGEFNDGVLKHISRSAENTLLAWGSYGALGGRGAHVAGLFPQGRCIGTCANGEPFHPARKSRALLLRPYH